MNWFLIALSCAFLTACCDAVSKRIMQRYDEWATGTVLLGLGCVSMVPMVPWMTLQSPSAELGALMLVLIPLETWGYYLFLSSIRMAPLSLTIPLLAFTPLFTIISGRLILGESVSQHGAAGILLITCGAYLLNADLVNQGLFAPLKAIFSHAGSRRMMWVAVIWSFTTALGKLGATMYGPIQFGFLILAGVTVAFGAVCHARARKTGSHTTFRPDSWGLLALGGLLVGLVHVTHFVSLTMINVSYMISIKRLSLIFGVCLGYLMFGEQNIKYRLVGASVMVAGVFFLYN
ncbi:MAG: DMT family transporter [Thermodesulfobacteriota bacterium]